jgi:hypothetical protein
MLKILIFGFFFYNNNAFAQWWNLSEPKDFDECIIRNMKSGMGDEAVRAIRRSCINKYPPKADLKKIELDARYKKCKIESDHMRNHMFLSVDPSSSTSLQAANVISKFESRSFKDSYISFQNKNSFGISGVLLGFTKSKQCTNVISDFKYTAYCTATNTNEGISSNSYGSLWCRSLPSESKSMGYCMIAFSPRYNQFDNSFLNFSERNGFCN